MIFQHNLIIVLLSLPINYGVVIVIRPHIHV